MQMIMVNHASLKYDNTDLYFQSNSYTVILFMRMQKSPVTGTSIPNSLKLQITLFLLINKIFKSNTFFYLPNVFLMLILPCLKLPVFMYMQIQRNS